MSEELKKLKEIMIVISWVAPAVSIICIIDGLAMAFPAIEVKAWGLIINGSLLILVGVTIELIRIILKITVTMITKIQKSDEIKI